MTIDVATIKEIIIPLGTAVIGAGITYWGTIKGWWGKKTADQKEAFLTDVREAAKDGVITVSEIIKIASKHF